MIYVDTSVVLAYLFGEDRRPPDTLWNETPVTSRLAEYEVWTRINARKLGTTLGETVRAVFHRIALLELSPPVLERALAPFPAPVRTLDALHLASADFLRQQGQEISLATYDDRMLAAGKKMKFKITKLS